jgi:hypothetical protein
MTISDVWNMLYRNISGIRSHEYYESSTGINIPIELVTPKFKKLDAIGNEIEPGDIIACDGGKWYGIELGILLGWTKNGYRVAPFHTNSNHEDSRKLKGGLISPHTVFLIKRKNSTILQ